MISPNIPANEQERLNAVRSYGLLDTLPEEEYDDLTCLIASVCETPISLITLLDADRNFLKSHHGIPISESPRDISFCGHAILEPLDLFIVEDARIDKRFEDNPLVKESQAIFYAGAPLYDSKGLALGTLCIFDQKPRKLTDVQKNTIISVARQVVKLFELNRNNLRLKQIEQELISRNEELKNFAGLVSHDLKSPLENITSLARTFKNEYGQSIDADGNQYLNYIEESSETLKVYIDGMLTHYRSDEMLTAPKEKIPLQTIYEEIEDMLFVDNAEFEHSTNEAILNVNKPALLQILLNLVGNALKYNHKDIPFVSTRFSEDEFFYYFEVEDNGMGIDEEKQKVIFDLFATGTDKDRHGAKGNGIGLATVKSLVTKLGGTIQVASTLGQGTTFSFTVKK